MESIRKDAYSLICEINRQFQNMAHRGIYDEIKFQENLNEILRILKKSEIIDNRLLIALTKFYQRSSMLFGLSSIQFSEEIKLAWRAYDQFYFERIKPNLKVYGAVGIV